jgi:hypothetical protein
VFVTSDDPEQFPARLLDLDLGTRLGWAEYNAGRVISGSAGADRSALERPQPPEARAVEPGGVGRVDAEGPCRRGP